MLPKYAGMTPGHNLKGESDSAAGAVRSVAATVVGALTGVHRHFQPASESAEKAAVDGDGFPGRVP